MTTLQTLVRRHNQGALQAYLSYLDAPDPAVRRSGRSRTDALRTPGSMI
jgi:hypothetical protein